jgi:hypothetical protein
MSDLDLAWMQQQIADLSSVKIGVCDCGRDLAWMQQQIADLSKILARIETIVDEAERGFSERDALAAELECVTAAHDAIRGEMYLWGIGEQDAEATVDAIGKALRAGGARAAQEETVVLACNCVGTPCEGGWTITTVALFCPYKHRRGVVVLDDPKRPGRRRKWSRSASGDARAAQEDK